MPSRNAKAALPIGATEDYFGDGHLDTNVWRPTTATLPSEDSYVTSYAPANLNYDFGMVRVALNQTSGASSGGHIVSRTRYNYGSYEFVLRVATSAESPNAPGALIPGTLTEFGLFFDGDEGGYNSISLKHEGQWQRGNQFTATNSDGSGMTTTVLEAPAPEAGFYSVKIVWESDRIEYFVQGKLLATVTTNVPSIAANAFFAVRGANDANDGGLAALNSPRYAYLSYFRWTPSSTNLARNSSFETKFQSFLRPQFYAPFSTGGAGGVEPRTSWSSPTGRTGGTALGLTAVDAHGFANYSEGPPEVLPKRWGVRTASWEDPDPTHKPYIDQAGIKTQWTIGIWYTCTFYAKKTNGASWTNLGLSWSAPPNQQEELLNPNLTTEWQRYSFRWMWSNPVEPFGNFFINVVGATAAGDTLIIDDLDIYVGDAVRPFIPEASLFAPPVVITPPNNTLPAKLLSTYWTGYQTPCPLDQLPTQYNHVFLFQIEPSGLVNGKGQTGGVTYPYYNASPLEDVQALRARGVRVSTTFGGAGAAMYFKNRNQSNRFLEEYDEVYNNLGGVDGCDFNNFELFSAEPQRNWRTGVTPTMAEWLAEGHFPASQGAYSIAGWDNFNAEMVYIAQQMKSRYGSSFIISAPAAVGPSFAPNDRRLAAAWLAAGVLDFVQPQFYDSSDVVVPSAMKYWADDWINNTLGGDESKWGIVTATNYHATNGSTVAQSVAGWNLIEAAHPNVRLAGCWNAYTDGTNGWAFANGMFTPVRG